MREKDAIGTEQNLTSDEAVMNEFNFIEQIYKSFLAPFGLD